MLFWKTGLLEREEEKIFRCNWTFNKTRELEIVITNLKYPSICATCDSPIQNHFSTIITIPCFVSVSLYQQQKPFHSTTTRIDNNNN